MIFQKIFMIVIYKLFIYLALQLILLSCSADDIGDITSPTQSTDNLAPSVSSTSPSDSDTFVSVSSSISVTFNKSMNSQTVTTNIIDTSCSETLQVSYDNFVSCIKMKTSPLITNSNQTYIITPYDNLSLATNYKIKVTYGVEDTSGKLMKNEYETLNGFNISAIQIGSSEEDIGYGLKVDNSNNIYITGHTYGGLDSNNNLGSADVILVKYDSNNKKIWTKQIGTPKEEKANGITIDSSNNIYISGYTKGKFDNDTYSSRPDIFLSKFNSGGTNQWIKSFGTPFDDYSNGIAVDSSGNIYISGYTKGDFDNDSITANPDIILLKYNSSGTKLWHKQIGTSFDDRGNGIAIDSSNNIYITGYSKGDLDNKTNSGRSDAFLMKFDSGGSKQWTKLIGTSSDDIANDIIIDSSNNIYITGYSNGHFDNHTNTGNSDIFISKYNSTGNKQWSKLFGSNLDDVGNELALDSLSNIYITGYSKGNLDNKTNSGNSDIFISKYNSDGSNQKTELLGTSSDDKAYSVQLDSNNQIYITGYTNGFSSTRDSNIFLVSPILTQ